MQIMLKDLELFYERGYTREVGVYTGVGKEEHHKGDPESCRRNIE